MGGGTKRIVRTALCAALAAALAIGAPLAGCSSTSSQSSSTTTNIAAYYGDKVLSEDEITSYTQSFREANNLTDDHQWNNYLTLSGYTVETWRENVIRQKVDRELVRQRASELGVTVDDAKVSAYIDEMRSKAGIAADDDKAWTDYLKQYGKTPESLREDYNFSSLEQQLFEKESDLSTEARSEMCTDYLKTNFADQVVRHYYALTFDLQDQQGTTACLQELEGLSGDALVQRFDQLIVERKAANESFEADLGWDFLYDENTIDPEGLLRNAKLNAGQLYSQPLTGTDALRVVYCAEREAFSGTISYDAIESANLKTVIAELTMASQWAAMLQQYLEGLEAKANVQVVPLPEGLPYDVKED